MTGDVSHRPVKFVHLHAGIADYFHHGGQPFHVFFSQPTKMDKSGVSLYIGISNRLTCGI